MVKRFTSHTLMALAEASLVALLVVGLMAGTAFAGKGAGGGGGKPPKGGSTSGTLALVLLQDANGNGAPNWNDTITFTVTTSAQYPTVDVRCYQAGSLVYSGSAGWYESYPWPGARIMPLYSPSWTGGAATCSAVINTGGKLDFSVGA